MATQLNVGKAAVLRCTFTYRVSPRKREKVENASITVVGATTKDEAKELARLAVEQEFGQLIDFTVSLTRTLNTFVVMPQPKKVMKRASARGVLKAMDKAEAAQKTHDEQVEITPFNEKRGTVVKKKFFVRCNQHAWQTVAADKTSAEIIKRKHNTKVAQS